MVLELQYLAQLDGTRGAALSAQRLATQAPAMHSL